MQFHKTIIALEWIRNYLYFIPNLLEKISAFIPTELKSSSIIQKDKQKIWRKLLCGLKSIPQCYGDLLVNFTSKVSFNTNQFTYLKKEIPAFARLEIKIKNN